MARPKKDVERVNHYEPTKIMKALRHLAAKRATTYSELMRTANREYVIREMKLEKGND